VKTLVLGLGNPILSDDGVGIRVAEELEGKVDPQEVTVMETSMAGFRLWEDRQAIFISLNQER